MKYVPPIGGAAGDPYVDGNPSTGVEGSAVPAAAIEHPQREIENTITDAGLAAADADLHQLSKAIQSGKLISAVAAGTADAITGAFSPAITALINGMTVHVRAASANATTTPSFKADGLAAKTIVKGNGLALVAGDILGAGHWIELKYDSVQDKWEIKNPATGASTATSGNDGTFSDNSPKPASTSWVRGAMSAIAIAAGFAVSLATNGYIKLPSWLGGWVVQWGIVQALGTPWTSKSLTFPIAFPTACKGVYPLETNTSTARPFGSGSVTVSGCSLWANGSSANYDVFWFAIGY